MHYGPGYDHPDRGYQESFGDKKTYEPAYKKAYQQGYQNAYNGTMANGYPGNYPAGDRDRDDQYGGLNNPGARQGFQDGVTDGNADRAAGRAMHYGPGYDHPDRGYQDGFGDKNAYEQ